MHAEPECHVLGAAPHVEAIWIGVLALVASGGAGEQQHDRTRGHRLAMDLDVAHHSARLHG